MTASILVFAALIAAWAAFDYLGFGHVMTDQVWGNPVQRRPWDSIPRGVQLGYRLVQHAFVFGSAAWVATLGGPFFVGAVMAVAAFGFMPQDIGYHVVGGHVGHKHYRPFSMAEKVKAYSLHYWPIRAWIIVNDYHVGWHEYPDGVPAKYETWGRIIGTALAVTIVAFIL